MNPTEITATIDLAEHQLRNLRRSILIGRQEGWSSEIAMHVDGLRTLRERSGELGLSGLKATLTAVELDIQSINASGRVPDEAGVLGLLDLISHAEAEALKVRFAGDDAAEDLGELLDESFEVFQLDSLVQNESASESDVVSDEPDEFEPDAEMLEIFAIEADELLTGIESNLEILAASPEDGGALWEVRRHAHTFKGAAGIIGLKKPSQLAHRIEDLLDHLAQDQIVPTRDVIELIASAGTCLRSMVNGESTPAIADRIVHLYHRFDSVLAGPVHPDEPKAEVSEEPAERPVKEQQPAEAEPPMPQRPIVRVSISRLDELVGIVRDLVISRSVVDQQLADLERQVEALTQTTRRLQSSTARMESDFEASMLSSDLPAFAGRSPREHEMAETWGDLPEFDSLELDRYTAYHESSRQLSEAVQDCFAVTTALESLKASIETAVEEQRRLIEQTQEKVIQIRLIQFGSLTTRLQRAVRVTCEEENKNVELTVENPEVELDTDVLDSLVEPLMHLLRNAVVHGIENPETRRLVGKPEIGRVSVSVANHETHIELRVSDDGRGIAGTVLRERAVEAGLIEPGAAARLKGEGLFSLIFLPGLTSAEKLTMSAGRGVGMSIVKESIEAKNGTIAVESTAHQGTTFTVRIPISFAVTQALLVRANGAIAAVPLKSVVKAIDLPPDAVSSGPDGAVASVGDITLPVRFFGDQVPNSGRSVERPESLSAVEIGSTDSPYLLVVDEILKTEEIAVKPLGKPLDRLTSIIGAAMLGNGTIVPVLDPKYFFDNLAPISETPEGPSPPTKPTVLVVDDSPSVRHMTAKVIVAAGWDSISAKDGVDALEQLTAGVRPDIILTDVEMPRMDGYELVAAVKADPNLCSIPMVFITSRVSDKHRERAQELGISEYLTKPFVEAELIKTVKRLAAAKPDMVTA